jgi:calcineurin-like phosphoesterase family protein
MMNKIYFTADLHFGHKNVLTHCKNRPFAEENDTAAHDKWLMELWNTTVGKKDIIYILGDLTFFGHDEARRLLEKLPGRKHLIIGNHDKSVVNLANYFMSVTPLRDIVIKPTSCETLQDNLSLTLCHYPLVTWNRKPNGSIMLHGHCHGRLDGFNAESEELRFDVGIDGELARKCGGIVTLEAVYEAAVTKAGTDNFKSYANQSYKKELR